MAIGVRDSTAALTFPSGKERKQDIEAFFFHNARDITGDNIANIQGGLSSVYFFLSV